MLIISHHASAPYNSTTFTMKFGKRFFLFCSFVSILRENDAVVNTHECHNATPPTPSDKVGEISTFKINLDLPPEERWLQAVSSRKYQIRSLIEVLRTNADSLFGVKIFDILDEYLPFLTKTLPVEFYREIVGVSAGAEITVGEATLFNVFYEFFTVCTSILVQDSKGVVSHGRNLDFGFLMGWNNANRTWIVTELLRPLTVRIDFQRNGKNVYSSVNFVGYVGVLTAVKKGTFSLSVNERFAANGGYVGIVEWLLGRRNLKWIGVLTREVMEKARTYKEAQKMLAYPKLVAPAYFIVAGNKTNQGCVVTRGRNDYNMWELRPPSGKQKGGNETQSAWFLVQTNYDHWKKPPMDDDRITPSVRCIKALGAKHAAYTLYNVLSTPPVLNKLTVFTAIMDVQYANMKVWLQDCQNCPPWLSQSHS